VFELHRVPVLVDMLRLRSIDGGAGSDGCYQSPCRKISSPFRGLDLVRDRGYGDDRENMARPLLVADWQDQVLLPISRFAEPVCSLSVEALLAFYRSNSAPPFAPLESQIKATLLAHILVVGMLPLMTTDYSDSVCVSCDDRPRSK
jgi:hypothetical protein